MLRLTFSPPDISSLPENFRDLDVLRQVQCDAVHSTGKQAHEQFSEEFPFDVGHTVEEAAAHHMTIQAIHVSLADIHAEGFARDFREYALGYFINPANCFMRYS